MTHSRYECFILVTPAIAPLWYGNTSLHWCKSVSEVNQTVLLNLICETQQQWRQGRCTNCKLDAVLSHSTSGKLLQHIKKTFNKVDTVTNAAIFAHFSPNMNCTNSDKRYVNHFTWQLAHKKSEISKQRAAHVGDTFTQPAPPAFHSSDWPDAEWWLRPLPVLGR